MISPAQREYIDTLLEECQDRGTEIPMDLLTEIEDEDICVARASEIIDELKAELGWR